MRFDEVAVLDWSAASRPVTGANSIWIARVRRGERTETWNPATRDDAMKLLGDIANSRRGRLLIGVDFSLAFPAGFARAIGSDSWLDVWRAIDTLIRDSPSNANNRFEAAAELNRRATNGPAPFWGCPAAQVREHLRPRRQPHPFAEFRVAETRVAGTHSTWKLYTAGSVGGQTLLGIPRLLRLRESTGAAVWPFEDPSQAGVVIAEAYPSMWLRRPAPGVVKDRAQVESAAAALISADLTGWLDAGRRNPRAAEEGWILGA